MTEGQVTPEKDAKAAIDKRTAGIDELLSRQIDQVLHHPAFMQLQATWLGLHYLVWGVHTMSAVKIKVLNVSKKDLLRDFQAAEDIGDTALASKVRKEEFETPGGEPYGLLIADYGFGVHPEDTHLLSEMGKVGMSAHVPFIGAASAGFFGRETFYDFHKAARLRPIFNSERYLSWHLFRRRAHSRYVGLVLPGILMRLPFGRNSTPVQEFSYEERSTYHCDFVWGTAVWAFAFHVASTYERYGWFGGVRDRGERGEIPGLLIHEFATDTGVSFRGPAETSVSDDQYSDLKALGFIPLSQIKGTADAVFFESWSCHRPEASLDDETPVEYESAEMDCVLAASRIAHYVKTMLRQERQTFISAHACEQYLRKWIARFLVPEYARGSTAAAAFPLLEARFEVVVPSDASTEFLAIAYLLPQRGVGVLSTPVKVSIPVVLPLILASSEPVHAVPDTPGLPAPISHQIEAPVNGSISTREQFIRRLFIAEACLNNRKLDVAALILEDLAEQIDRFHLELWESPALAGQVWELLLSCYQSAPVRPDVEERCAMLLRRICRLDPARALE